MFDMTLDEVRIEKREIEAEIRLRLQSFIDKTNLDVDRVDIHMSTNLAGEKTIMAVILDMSL